MYHETDPLPNPPSSKVSYIRANREKTDSWLTIKLPKKMSMAEAEKWATKHLPGWEVVNGSPVDPDEEFP